ncbi:hypothetical protein AVEN_29430-1 [Araneus ventricosus]|uniref:Uncharacterized protein n=1 Tax=Araneus ventricosus TaxID=182803 RepID=A0A4Y2D0R9_ARAVE|nr:hypothetical protein AVEN_29430-1 [Araneus ventricosus]
MFFALSVLGREPSTLSWDMEGLAPAFGSKGNGTNCIFNLLCDEAQHRSSAFCSLVVFTSHFEATRGLFWDGPHNFEPRLDDEGDTRAGTPSPNFRTTPSGGRLTHDVMLNMYQAHMHNGSTVESGFEAEILRPRSRDLPYSVSIRQSRRVHSHWSHFLTNLGNSLISE